jgi:hypothetical protein
MSGVFDHRGKRIIHAGKRSKQNAGTDGVGYRAGNYGYIYDSQGFVVGGTDPEEQVDPPEADA